MLKLTFGFKMSFCNQWVMVQRVRQCFTQPMVLSRRSSVTLREKEHLINSEAEKSQLIIRQLYSQSHMTYRDELMHSSHPQTDMMSQIRIPLAFIQSASYSFCLITSDVTFSVSIINSEVLCLNAINAIVNTAGGSEQRSPVEV